MATNERDLEIARAVIDWLDRPAHRMSVGDMRAIIAKVDSVRENRYEPRDEYERGAVEAVQAFNLWLNDQRTNLPACDTSLIILWPLLLAHREALAKP